jgi:hypothetical protein
MRTRFALVIATLTLSAGLGLAQYPPGAVGLWASTSNTNIAGHVCHGFSCTPANLNITAGDVVTVGIRGEWQAPYLLATAASATSCVAVPGILNSLVLDLPATIVLSGTLANPSPILSCPDGYTTITATLPPGFPIGTTIPIQALTYGPGTLLAFTGAIVLTIT